MAKQVFRGFILRNTNGGADFLAHTNLAGSRCFEDVVCLGPYEIEIDVPEVDTTLAQIEALERQVEAERTDSQVRVNLLLDRISKLQAIGHEVAGDE